MWPIKRSVKTVVFSFKSSKYTYLVPFDELYRMEPSSSTSFDFDVSYSGFAPPQISPKMSIFRQFLVKSSRVEKKLKFLPFLLDDQDKEETR